MTEADFAFEPTMLDVAFGAALRAETDPDFDADAFRLAMSAVGNNVPAVADDAPAPPDLPPLPAPALPTCVTCGHPTDGTPHVTVDAALFRQVMGHAANNAPAPLDDKTPASVPADAVPGIDPGLFRRSLEEGIAVSTTTLLRSQRRVLAAAGYVPADIGRVFNRANPAPVAPPSNGAVDPEDLSIPDSPAALEEMLGDSKKMQRVFGNKDALSSFLTNYARNYLAKEMDLAKQVRNQVETELQKFVSDWVRDEGAEGIRRPDLRVPEVGKPGNARSKLYNPRAMGAALDKDFESSSEFFRTIWHNVNKTADVQTKLQRVRNAFSSTVPSEGGFLIPEVLRAEILSLSLETAIVRPRARVIPMDSLRVPFPAIDSTSNVSSVYGGIVAYWTEEGAALTASAASFGRVVLDAKKLTVYTQVPNELISDSLVSFQALLDQLFPEAMGFYEDDAFLGGDGVGKPLGVTKSAAMIEVAKESGQVADTIVWENLVKMFSRMLPGSLNRAVWLVSPNCFPELATMALSVGTGGSAIWLTNGVAMAPITILGRPVIVTEKSPPLGDAGDISFVDFGFYLIGDRQVMSAMSSPHYRFGNDETAYRIIQRVDGRPWLNSAITPKNNGPTLSPFVRLAERA